MHVEEKKPMRIAKRCAIRLSIRGINLIEFFFKNDKKLPSVQHFDKKMKEWSTLAGLRSEGVSARSLRKTLESWLVAYYPNNIAMIYSSQGHNELTFLQSYQNFGFINDDIAKMKEWIDGYV